VTRRILKFLASSAQEVLKDRLRAALGALATGAAAFIWSLLSHGSPWAIGISVAGVLSFSLLLIWDVLRDPRKELERAPVDDPDASSFDLLRKVQRSAASFVAQAVGGELDPGLDPVQEASIVLETASRGLSSLRGDDVRFVWLEMLHDAARPTHQAGELPKDYRRREPYALHGRPVDQCELLQRLGEALYVAYAMLGDRPHQLVAIGDRPFTDRDKEIVEATADCFAVTVVGVAALPRPTPDRRTKSGWLQRS
jgi:hypothetical protein